MPGGNKTGPDGQGPKTGRGLGFCSGSDSPGYESNEAPQAMRRGNGRANGRGNRRGMGAQRGFGPNGGGRGRNFNYNSTMSIDSEIVNRLDKIEKTLTELQK